FLELSFKKGKESLQEENQQKISTAEARISEDPMEVRVAAARLMQQKSESPPAEESKGSCGIYVGRV
ncbi:hypothetical protein Dimus_037669, partial [Dionaea muscipula]